MIAVLAALASAVVYGVSDFVGGVAARRIAPVRVVAVSAATGVAILLPLSLLIPAEWSTPAVLWGAASGAANSLAILLLYASLAIGPMSILSPLTAVLGALVPVVAALLAGERLSPLAWVGVAVAITAVLLVGLARGERVVRPSLRGLSYATASGVFIGVVLVLLDRAPAASGVVPLLFNRATSGTILAVAVVVGVVLARRRGAVDARGWRGGIRLALLCGGIDTLANSLILVALRAGELGITSVLVGLYPASTIALAAVVLRERLSGVQWVGLVLAVAAAGVLAAA